MAANPNVVDTTQPEAIIPDTATTPVTEPKAIDLMDPTLTLTRLAELQEEQRRDYMEAEEERVASEIAAKYHAMLVGTLHEGELTARSCILMYRVDHFLKQLEEWVEGKRKQLPKL